MRFEDTIRCDGCGIEVLGAVEVFEGHDYCCSDCAQGFKCSCQPEIEVDTVEQGAGGQEGLPRFWENP